MISVLKTLNGLGTVNVVRKKGYVEHLHETVLQTTDNNRGDRKTTVLLKFQFFYTIV